MYLYYLLITCLHWQVYTNCYCYRNVQSLDIVVSYSCRSPTQNETMETEDTSKAKELQSQATEKGDIQTTTAPDETVEQEEQNRCVYLRVTCKKGGFAP